MISLTFGLQSEGLAIASPWDGTRCSAATRPASSAALQDAGLQTTGDGLQFSLRDQGGDGQPDGRLASSSLLVQDTPLPDLPARGYASYTARAGGIDIHV